MLCSSLSQYNIVNNTTRCWMGYLSSSPSASVVLEYLEIPRAYLHDVEYIGPSKVDHTVVYTQRLFKYSLCKYIIHLVIMLSYIYSYELPDL